MIHYQLQASRYLRQRHKHSKFTVFITFNSHWSLSTTCAIYLLSLWFHLRHLLLSTFRGLLLRLLRTPSRWIPVKPKVIQLFKPLLGEPVRLFLVPLSILSTLIHYPPRQLLVQWVTVWYSTVLLFVCMKEDRCWWAKVGEGDSDERKLKPTYSFLPFKFNQFIVP